MITRPTRLEKLLAASRQKHIPKDQIILYQDDHSQEVFVIRRGVVKLHNIDAQGNEKILHLVGDAGLIPFAFFSGDDQATHWFYTALTDCDMYVVPKEKLQIAMQADNIVAIYLMNWFSNEVHELLMRLDSLGKTNVRDKLMAVLKFLAVRHSRQRSRSWWRVSFPVNHQLLADMIGMTRESTAAAMKELADEKIIRNPRQTVLEIDLPKVG